MGEQKKLREYRHDDSGRVLGLSVTVCLHMAVVYGLLQHNTVTSAIIPPQPLMVSIVREAQPVKPEPVAPPKPEPVVERKPHPPVQHKPKQVPPPAGPQPIATPKPERSALIAAATPEPASQGRPAPVEQAPPRPTPAPVAAAVSEPAAAPVIAKAAPPANPTAPRFDADYLQNPAPRYPPLARRMRQEGKVVLRVLVDSGGGASQIEVRNSSGSDVLDEAALEAVKRWRFVPARRDDQPVAAWVLVPITFTLQG
jgi:periplasmic protein TonB